MTSHREIVLMMVMKASKREDAAQVLTNYIETHGFVSDETAETIRKILEEKDKEPKISVTEIKQTIKEIEDLPDTVYSDNIMDVKGVSWKHMKDKVINIIKRTCDL